MATSPSLRPVTPPNASDAAAEVQNSPVPVKSAHLELQRHVSSQKPQSHPQQQQKTTEDALARKAQASSAKDIYSLQDRELAARYCFQSEVGSGNWGSVWQCQPREDKTAGPVAVKLVHRTKTTTTAARVRSLWGEFKILRHFKGREHESLIAFQDFIITPSYALVVMDFHPRLIPVEMPETRAKRYIAQLLSALDYLHTEGCTHNDIKPSNILLSKNDKAVLCDFGFAQRYSFEPHTDTNSNTGKIKQPFMSTLSWGTPEYLSPERVKSQLHDERLSDLWSLGVTAYELVVGRTPFEANESEEFLDKDALEVYYQRTLTETFFGCFTISTNFESLIQSLLKVDPHHRPVSCSQALDHPFFDKVARHRHNRGSRIARPVSACMTAPQTPAAVKTHKITALADVQHDKAYHDTASAVTSSAHRKPTEARQGAAAAVLAPKRTSRVPVKVYQDEKDGMLQSSSRKPHHPSEDQENTDPNGVHSKPQTPLRNATVKSLRAAPAPLRDSPGGGNNLAKSIRPGQSKMTAAAAAADKPVSQDRMREILRPRKPSSAQPLLPEEPQEELADHRGADPALVAKVFQERAQGESTGSKARKLTRSYRSPSLTSRSSSLSLNALKSSLGRSASSLRLTRNKEERGSRPPSSRSESLSRAVSRNELRSPEPFEQQQQQSKTVTAAKSSQSLRQQTGGGRPKTPTSLRPRSFTTGSAGSKPPRPTTPWMRYTGRSTPDFKSAQAAPERPARDPAQAPKMHDSAYEAEAEAAAAEDDTIRIPPSMSGGPHSAPIEGVGRTVTFAAEADELGDQENDPTRPSISSMRSSFSFIHILRPRTSLSDFARSATPNGSQAPDHHQQQQQQAYLQQQQQQLQCSQARPLSRRMTSAVKGFFR